jgi:PilZ domain
MEEKRQGRRTRVLKGAKIMFDGHASTIDCTVRNLTATGACLSVASPIGIPPTFDLSLDGGRTLRLCRMVWWKAERIGVAFDKGSAKSKKVSEAPPSHIWSRICRRTC